MSDKLGRPDGFVPHAFVDQNGISYGSKNTDGSIHVIPADTTGLTINPSTEDTLDAILVSLRRLIDAQLVNPTIDMANYRNRVTAVLESGTVTTVSTITNVAGVGGYQPQDIVFGSNLTAWASCCRGRIS